MTIVWNELVLEAFKKNIGLPDIYCDLDEVLVAFLKGADAVVDGSFIDAPRETRWIKVNQVKGFWTNLDWMPGAKRLYQFISKYEPHVLSAYTSKDPASKNGKMKWLSKNANFKRSKIHLVLRSQKKSYAITDGKPNVLIDDYKKNITEWEAAGGIGVHHTSVSKTLGELKRLGFK